MPTVEEMFAHIHRDGIRELELAPIQCGWPSIDKLVSTATAADGELRALSSRIAALGLRRIGLSQQVVPLEPPVQRAPAQTEPLRRRALVATRFGKHSHEVIALDDVKILCQRPLMAPLVGVAGLRATHAGFGWKRRL